MCLCVYVLNERDRTNQLRQSAIEYARILRIRKSIADYGGKRMCEGNVSFAAWPRSEYYEISRTSVCLDIHTACHWAPSGSE